MDPTQLNSLVPLAHVQSVPRSVEFYRRLGFVVTNTHTPEGGAEPVWAWLESGGVDVGPRGAVPTARMAVVAAGRGRDDRFRHGC